MDLTPMHKRVIALDVHQAKITACAVVEHEDGRVEVTKRDFGAFKRDRRALAQWALEIRPEVVVMESTGVYWKSPFAALEAVGIVAWVVNARHVKAVPGRKTDMADAQWLATLARAGLLRASFIPPIDFRQLRLVARQRQKLVGMCSAEKNRLHKVLVDAGIRINVLVADIHGTSARAMVKALIAGKPMHEVLDCKGRLRAGRDELFEALSTEQFSAVHRFVAEEIMQHIEQIEQRIARLDQRRRHAQATIGRLGRQRATQPLGHAVALNQHHLVVQRHQRVARHPLRQQGQQGLGLVTVQHHEAGCQVGGGAHGQEVDRKKTGMRDPKNHATSRWRCRRPA